MSNWVRIQYRDFWDVPRIFVVNYQGHSILFDCPFDETVEDFGDTYEVFLLPDLDPIALESADWGALRQQSVAKLPAVPIAHVALDPTKRQGIDQKLLDQLLVGVPTPATGS